MDRKTARLKEENLARKRNQEYHKQLFWDERKEYYKTWDLQTSKYNVWSAPEYRSNSAMSVARDAEDKKKYLDERRAKLKSLLEFENEMYENEIKEKFKIDKRKLYDKIPLGELEKIHFGIKEKEEMVRKNEADIRKYEQWRASLPILKTFQRKINQDSIKEAWLKQMKEKQEKEEREKELIKRMEEEEEKRRIEEEEKEKELIKKKEEHVKELKQYLLKQMETLSDKGKKTEELKQQERLELKLKEELEKIAIERSRIEKQRNARQHSAFLRQQFQSKLKDKTKQVQDELQQDKMIIEQLNECIKNEEERTNKMRLEERKAIDKANIILKESMQLEKLREKQMEFMFCEEARKMWQNQEEKWKAEQEARNNLMMDVLTTIQQQVKEKLKDNTKQQNELIEQREELLKCVENAKEELETTEMDILKKKRQWKEELKNQVEEKENERKKSLEEERKEFDKNKESLAEEEQRILQELRKMSITPLSNESYRRKKFFIS